VPGAATGLAEVGAGDQRPLEVRRRGEHRPQTLAVRALLAGAFAQGQPRRGDPPGEGVALALEIAEPEDPGLGAERANAVLDLNPTKSLPEQPGQLALEPADLNAQLGAGGTLVDTDVEPLEALPFEQILHTPRTESK
jgi:hypothetical protein